MTDNAKHTPTRYRELGYANYGRGLWRIVDAETGAAIGPHYATKAELLADLERYANAYGCNGVEAANAAPKAVQS